MAIVRFASAANVSRGLRSSSLMRRRSGLSESIRGCNRIKIAPLRFPPPFSLLNRTTSINPTTPSRHFSEVPSSIKKTSPYFDKVLIANRGEIAIRVARTCRRLGIRTVAVYASNDSASKHIAECDEAFCLGSGGDDSTSNVAYLDESKIMEAIVATNADAVHPGYGFLSENASFARKVVGSIGTSHKVAWLGPPPQAIVDMGCKIRSKEIARRAGVAIIPGGDEELESLDKALDAMQEQESSKNQPSLRYPVLLKAAAGGGGKGMRICYSDQELIEAYPLAKSEGLKFFADDRLLLEQYLENPHHIEFQVLCTPSNDDGVTANEKTSKTDVAIFVERECSVQRRNQKVVEESPSCMLTEATRSKMMLQTALLCQSVGYEGAGTVEWLVHEIDGEQYFYFLEMNTRLQVEHPITEAVSGNIDLVEVMLQVGAGKGLPSDWYEAAKVVELDASDTSGGGKMLVMPWSGHAIEGRIYAEDPLRGYLPSTGPLVPYKEPIHAIRVDDGSKGLEERKQSYLRLDSGVVEGHVVTPHYDPMLSKIISFAPTRREAIDVLMEGLSSYVIQGVNHNAKLVHAVLRHPTFQRGNTPTSFLDTHIPDFGSYNMLASKEADGSTYVDKGSSSLLDAQEEEALAIGAALIWKTREEKLGRPPLVGGNPFRCVVRLDGMFGYADPVRISFDQDGVEAKVERLVGSPRGNGKAVVKSVNPIISVDFENFLAFLQIDDQKKPYTIQVLGEESSGELQLQMCGAEYSNCLVQSPREYELSKYMLPPKVEDTSDMILSPMPGTLIGFSDGVHAGSYVEAGQELCVVEAMKMQNVIRAPREGVIARLCVEEGTALVTDQTILEYEAIDEETAA